MTSSTSSDQTLLCKQDSQSAKDKLRKEKEVAEAIAYKSSATWLFGYSTVTIRFSISVFYTIKLFASYYKFPKKTFNWNLSIMVILNKCKNVSRTSFLCYSFYTEKSKEINTKKDRLIQWIRWIYTLKLLTFKLKMLGRRVYK